VNEPTPQPKKAAPEPPIVTKPTEEAKELKKKKNKNKNKEKKEEEAPVDDMAFLDSIIGK
jgi:hypothetical protein